MDLLQERMKEQKRLREDARASHRKNQYTPIDIDSSGSSRESSGSGVVAEGRDDAQKKSTTLPASKRASASRLQPEEPIKAGKKKPLPAPPKKKAVGGAALIEEIKNKTLAKTDKPDSKPTPRTKPKPSVKPGKAVPEPVEFEAPAYANCGFKLNQQSPEPPEPADESLYMNVSAPPPPQFTPAEYQNVGTKMHRKKH